MPRRVRLGCGLLDTTTLPSSHGATGLHGPAVALSGSPAPEKPLAPEKPGSSPLVLASTSSSVFLRGLLRSDGGSTIRCCAGGSKPAKSSASPNDWSGAERRRARMFICCPGSTAGVLALGRSRNSCRLNSAASKSRGDAQGSSVSGRCRGSSTSWFIDSLAGSDPRRIVSIGAARRPGGTPVIAWRPAESRSSYLQSSSVAQQPQQPSKRHE